MNKYFILMIVIAIIVGGLLLVARQNQTPRESGQSQVANNSRSKAPNFSLQNYEGKTITLADFADQPLVINSWAAWCPFCRAELFDFAAVQQEFKDRVVIIAIDRAEPLDVAKGFTDEIKISSNLIFLLDPTDSFYQSIGGFSMPETIFVDKEGFIRDHKRGPMDLDEIRQRIQKIL